MSTTTLALNASATTCCASVLEPSLSQDQAVHLAGIFKALSDPTRVRLLSLIAAAAGDEACICDLTGPVGLSQPTVSHHMKKLTAAGLVEREQRGRWAYYRLAPGALDNLSAALTAPRPR
ncbi:ArsR/SmtB family transcription factor [Aeromicrobium sp. CTD01-1L150]|uniref:ArsR/SmtB family transcription factor n=1 Tax=Aeromicrobium sp. CTD01-1L150 TaxID=3341830 RepID=UPI0035C0D0DC